jgi:hypothetical protein
MRLYIRPTVALFAMAFLVLGLRSSLGFWLTTDRYGWVFIVAMATLAMAFVATVMPDRAIEGNRNGSRLELTDLLFMGVGLLLIGVNTVTTGLAYLQNIEARVNMIRIALAGCFVFIAFVVIYHKSILSSKPGPFSRQVFAAFAIASVLLGFAFRGLVLVASPDPIIDVYALARDNADHVLHGRNPYQNDIVSPYDTAAAYSLGIFEPDDPRPAAYPPHSFLAAAPFRLFGGDARWPNVIGDTLAAVAIFGVGVKRGRPMTAYLAATTWLFVPRSAFIIEQAWFEPMLGGLLGVGLWLSEFTGGRKWLGYILLGLGLTAKQFGLPLLPALAWPHRRNWLPLIVGLAVGGLVMLPFFLWSPHDFIDIVLKKHLVRPPQYHSITIASAFFHFGGVEMVPDKKWCWAAAVVLIGIVSLRGPRNGAATALGLGTALMIFSTFHTQGFPNYFYLVEYLWLLGAVGLLPPLQPAESAPPAGQAG